MRKTMCKILTLTLAAMMICTNAFAAVTIGDVTYDTTTGDIATIPVSGLTGGSEVAVLVVEEGTSLSSATLADSIVYIDQVTLGASATTLDVTSVASKLRTLDEAYTKVDIYVGQSGSSDAAASKTSVKINNSVVYEYSMVSSATISKEAAFGTVTEAELKALILKKEQGSSDTPAALTDVDTGAITLKDATDTSDVTLAAVNTAIANATTAGDTVYTLYYAGNKVGTFTLSITETVKDITSIAVAGSAEVKVAKGADDAAVKAALVAAGYTISNNKRETVAWDAVTVAADTSAVSDSVTATITYGGKDASGTVTTTVTIKVVEEAPVVGIKGVVKNKAGAGIMGAAVTAIKLESTDGLDVFTTQVYGAYTNAEGEFLIEAPAGNYMVYADYNGYVAMEGFTGQMNYYATTVVEDTVVVNDGVTEIDGAIVLGRTYKEDINGDGVVNATDKNAVMGSSVWYKDAYTD